ncbi:TerB N-terminal domain-containing protein [Butyrivibrio sp. MC2013]|uniref:TerB N-terminal domain-containing protein n=1 Tax=Butyrivibrio sp. MC2013 TaxID=1280686 RepID=UPI000414E790|nr:TerB N-terminal domain-containing protein [Butyrivibrio sp. MC2013]
MIPQTSLRNQILDYCRDKYHISPVYPWDLLNEYAVLRHDASKKWFGLIMNVEASRLGLQNRQIIDVLDVRADSADIVYYLGKPGFLPAYHMSKSSWLTILLDGSACMDTIIYLLEKSYDLTKEDGAVRFTSTYSDEAIPLGRKSSASLPDKLKELKALYDPFSRSSNYEALCFYKQAKLAEDYEDGYVFTGRFIRFYPTYHVMNDDQLRGYFAWRTDYRHGKVHSTSISFIYLYLYELLAGIGVTDPLEGFHAIQKIDRIFGDKDPGLHDNISLWLNDYVIYYNLDHNLLEGNYSSDILSAIAALSDPQNISMTDEEIFACLCRVSHYDPLSSLIYKKLPSDMVCALARVYRGLDRYLKEHDQHGLIERSYGHKAVIPCHLFRTAVFYDHLQYEDYEYKVNSGRVYRCKKGNWTLEGYITSPEKSKEIGAICKETDRQLRALTGLGHPLKKTMGLSPSIIGMIGELVREYLKDKETAAKPVINIDFSRLGDIRKDAAVTRDKLIIDEDEAEFILGQSDDEETGKIPGPSVDNETGIIPGPSVDDEKEEAANPSSPFTPIQKEILSLLLQGGDLNGFAASERIMLSVEIDEINNFFYDELGDTVIEYDEDKLCLVEDYIPDLQKYL